MSPPPKLLEIKAVCGMVKNPMTRSEAIDKARDLIAPVLGHDPAERLIEVVLAIETLAKMRPPRLLLRSAS
ncbi:MAG TPA: hypothetical protein VKX28_18770 [Xanthobacteraceae bacterium]|nr:hypothetical protein [Xanthobacteraceae bacterium]